jgi:hypothetical protein
LLIFTAGAIPIGIAVGRQRQCDTNATTSNTPTLQAKDLNRFSLGLTTDLGECWFLRLKIFCDGSDDDAGFVRLF